MHFGNNSLIISALRHEAEHIARCADWDRGHMHESGTTQEWETRRDLNANRDRQARALHAAADHFKAMWGNV